MEAIQTEMEGEIQEIQTEVGEIQAIQTEIEEGEIQTVKRDSEEKRNSEEKKKRGVKAKKKRGSSDSGHEWVILMVVACLVAAMSFQMITSPPGGLYQDVDEEIKGTSIFGHQSPGAYAIFISFNTVSFTSSLSIVFLLVSGLPFRSRILMWILMGIMWIALMTISVSYLIAALVITHARVSWNSETEN